MKRIFALCFCMVSLTACFRTKLYVGNVQKQDPVVEINRENLNSHFIGGLVAGKDATMHASEYTNDASNYVIKTNMSFVNGLLSGITFGIYTPTQTKFYIPIKEIDQQNAAN